MSAEEAVDEETDSLSVSFSFSSLSLSFLLFLLLCCEITTSEWRRARLFA